MPQPKKPCLDALKVQHPHPGPPGRQYSHVLARCPDKPTIRIFAIGDAPEPALSLLSLFWGEFLAFVSPARNSFLLSVFPFFSRDFRGSVGTKILVFLVGFPCHSQRTPPY